MKNVNTILAVGAVAVVCGAAEAAVLASWSIASAISTSGTSYSYGVADAGDAAAGTSFSGYHAAAGTSWTSPTGNGSTYSISSNNWAVGDYYEARFSSVGYGTLSVEWDQARSGLGPSSFELVMSTNDGASFTSVLGSYAVLQSGGGGAPGTWGAATRNAIYTMVETLDASANNRAEVILRFRALSAGSTTAGTNRIDNISISGTLASVPGVPAPGAAALGVAALGGMAGLITGRRRKE